MDELYLPLKEAAELEKIEYKTFWKQLSNKVSKGDLMLKNIKSEAGGRDRKYIKLSDLSKKAQATYKALQKSNSKIEGSDLIVDELNKNPDPPWYLDTDINWYIENNKTAYYKAVELSQVIKEIIEFDGLDKTGYVQKRAAELGISQRTLYRNIDNYTEASGWELKLLKDTGVNYDYYKILCLCRKPKDTGTFPSFTPEIRQLIKNIWCNNDFRANQGTKEMLYTKLKEVSRETNWRIPSYPSVCRYVIHLMEVEKIAEACFLAEKGIREYKNKRMMKKARDTSALKVMEVVMGDEHTFDCWVSYRHANGKISAIKPKLVIWIDVRSRMVMGDLLCQDANSQILKESILKMMYSNPGGLPKYLHIDNGKDYTSKEMTGIERQIRYKEFWEETDGFLYSVGIEDYHRSAPYEPWDKAEMERFFKTVCDRFTRWMKSYTGTLTGSKTGAKVSKDIKKMLEQGKLMTIEKFYEAWQKWLQEDYMVRQHRGLKDMKEEYCTPLSLFENGERYEKALPPKSYAIMQLMKKDHATVTAVGIKKFGNYYTASELTAYKNKSVNIMYDPEDVTRLYVYDESWKSVCEAVSYELLQFGHSIPQKEVEEHKKEQNRQIKDAKKILDEATRPLDERIAGAAAANRIVGGMMLEGKGNNEKVVTLPTDPVYREEVKNKKTKQRSEYIANMGESTLDKLRNMG